MERRCLYGNIYTHERYLSFSSRANRGIQLIVADVIVVSSSVKLYRYQPISDGDATVELFGRSKITEDGVLL